MSETNPGDAMELKLDDALKPEIQEHPSSPEQDEEKMKKKYGPLRKKHPLISKDHDHAFFDSADWALGKHGAQKSKGPLEELRPKLQPTPHQQVRSRRSAYAPSDDSEGHGYGDCSPSEDGQEKAKDGDSESDQHPEAEDVSKGENDPEKKDSQS